jgi:hypothetical protein
VSCQNLLQTIDQKLFMKTIVMAAAAAATTTTTIN